MEFDASRAFAKSTLIWIFRNGLKPSITTQIEEYKQENDTWEKLIKKTVKVKAKISLLLSFFVQNID